MNTAGIFIKTEPETKKKAEKTDLDKNGEIPSEYLIKMIRQAEKALKEGKASPTFKTGEEAIAYLEKQGI